MDFMNLSFLPFIGIVFVLYFTLFRKKQWILLLIASVVFYLFSGPKNIVFILATTVMTYLITRKFTELYESESAEKKQPDVTKDIKKQIGQKYSKARKKWLLLDLFVVIGLLAVMKYTNFALSGVSALLALFHVDWSRQLAIVMPLGISFYTFMAIGYTLDVYWGRYKAEKNFFKYACFAFYFPHILQGPIARYNKLSPQLAASHEFDYDRLAKGLQLMLWGYFEKMVIADRLSIFATNVYAEWETAPGSHLIIAIIFFSMKLYLDFQGCMDIGRGISQVMGIDLELNFWHPYFSKTMQEFWRRWHITLGAWFKDYLLYPVSMTELCKTINRSTRKKWGNNASRICSSIIPTICVWLITGIWHGAATSYILWGIYHGCLIIGGTVLEGPFKKLGEALHINMESWFFGLFQMVRTFTLSAIGRIFFLAPGFLSALRIMKRTFNPFNFHLHRLWNGSLFEQGLDQGNMYLSFILILLIWCVGMLQERGNMVIRDQIAKQNIVIRWVLYSALIMAIIVFGIYGSGYNAAAFVYGGF